MYKDLSVSVVIPTWNEAKGIAYTIQSMPSIVDEVVVVDALSTDGTGDIARANGARVVPERRKGYGRAFKTGFNACKGDLLVAADGDGTYPVGALPNLLDFLMQSDLMFASCSRFPLEDPSSMRPRNRFGNQVISFTSSFLWNHRFEDVLSGMWAMRREAWVALDVVSDSWNFSEEIKVRAKEAFGPGFAEFHIRYAERLGETKLPTWRVGVENLVWLGLMRAGLERQSKAMIRPKPKHFPTPGAASDAPTEPEKPEAPANGAKKTGDRP